MAEVNEKPTREERKGLDKGAQTKNVRKASKAAKGQQWTESRRTRKIFVNRNHTGLISDISTMY